MARVAKDDPAALDRLIFRYWGSLVGFCHGYLPDVDAAEDVAQETFVRVWEHRTEWSPSGSVASYLYSIARNIALNRQRRRNVREESSESLRRKNAARHTSSPLKHAEAGELREAIDRAIETLPDRRREVFRLSRFEGLSYREIADVLDISPQTVANHMSAALADLREALAPLLDDSSRGDPS